MARLAACKVGVASRLTKAQRASEPRLHCALAAPSRTPSRSATTCETTPPKSGTLLRGSATSSPCCARGPRAAAPPGPSRPSFDAATPRRRPGEGVGKPIALEAGICRVGCRACAPLHARARRPAASEALLSRAPAGAARGGGRRADGGRRRRRVVGPAALEPAAAASRSRLDGGERCARGDARARGGGAAARARAAVRRTAGVRKVSRSALCAVARVAAAPVAIARGGVQPHGEVGGRRRASRRPRRRRRPAARGGAGGIASRGADGDVLLLQGALRPGLRARVALARRRRRYAARRRWRSTAAAQNARGWSRWAPLASSTLPMRPRRGSTSPVLQWLVTDLGEADEQGGGQRTWRRSMAAIALPARRHRRRAARGAAVAPPPSRTASAARTSSSRTPSSSRASPSTSAPRACRVAAARRSPS